MVISPKVVMITVRPRKSIRAMNWLLGGMLHVCVVHDRIAICDGFLWMHQECWAHLIRRFPEPAKKHGAGPPEHDRYVAIRARTGGPGTRPPASPHIWASPPTRPGWPPAGTGSKGCGMCPGPGTAPSWTALPGLVRDLDGREPGEYLRKMIPRALTFVACPGTPGTNNGTEGAVRWNVVRPRHVFGALPDRRAARNFGAVQTFAATCRRNGVSPHRAVPAGGRDPDWDVSASGAPPPTLPRTA